MSDQSRCPDAYLCLAAALGAVIGALTIGVRLLAYPSWVRRGG